ncbi:hypothetical protein DIPPA_24319 [Diplonema papillatum]|nr:hypothetical protein DIPPA_24319 [Diplonema papillatum]
MKLNASKAEVVLYVSAVVGALQGVWSAVDNRAAVSAWWNVLAVACFVVLAWKQRRRDAAASSHRQRAAAAAAVSTQAGGGNAAAFTKIYITQTRISIRSTKPEKQTAQKNRAPGNYEIPDSQAGPDYFFTQKTDRLAQETL